MPEDGHVRLGQAKPAVFTRLGAVLATWDIRSQTRRLHQPDFPFLSLFPYKIEGTAWSIEHRSFRLKSSMDEKASRTRQKSGMFVSFA
jgi:hypothetical protein